MSLLSEKVGKWRKVVRSSLFGLGMLIEPFLRRILLTLLKEARLLRWQLVLVGICTLQWKERADN